MNAIDITELQLDYALIRMALQELVWAIKEGEDVERMLNNATAALQWCKHPIEYGDECEDEDE